MTNFRIKVVSDTVCPWCYIGHRKLQAAQQLWAQRHPSSGDTFTIDHQPFQLNPDMPGAAPGSSVDKQAYYAERFGEARTRQIFARVTQHGEPVGIDFKFGGRTGNSRNAHRLVHLAKKYGPDVEAKTVQGLFAGYFENEQDITDLGMLRDVAAGAGIPADDFQTAMVDSDEGGAEVERAVSEAVFSGVQGVPDFTVQDAIHLNGARDPEDFIKAFDHVKMMEARDAK